MDESFSAINSEYELTEWEKQDEDWVKCGPAMWYLRTRIDPVESDRLMKERLRKTYG